MLFIGQPIQLEEVEVTGKNPAGAILKAGVMSALVASQLDSPLPGPGDVVGVGTAGGTLISAGVAWIGYENIVTINLIRSILRNMKKVISYPYQKVNLGNLIKSEVAKDGRIQKLEKYIRKAILLMGIKTMKELSGKFGLREQLILGQIPKNQEKEPHSIKMVS